MKYLLLVAALFAVACSEDTVNLPDHKQQIDQNSAEIALLKAHNDLQDIRINSLEVRMSDLELRVEVAETNIDINTGNIVTLFDQVENLDDELSSLRRRFYYAYYELKAADRQTRRMLRNEVRSLRVQLYTEIFRRQLADYQLQQQIDDVESDLQSFESQQQIVNSLLTGAMFLTNLRINQLQSQITSAIVNLNNRMNNIQSQINSINTEISSIQSTLTNISSQLDSIEDRLVSVVYPCGEGNSQEVLLETQDGLVAYFQQMRTVTDTIEVGETVPAHTICTHPWKQPPLFNCPPGHVQTVPESQNSTPYSVEVEHDVLQKAYLDILDDGNYRTTDGYSCNFSIVNGEVQ